MKAAALIFATFAAIAGCSGESKSRAMLKNATPEQQSCMTGNMKLQTELLNHYNKLELEGTKQGQPTIAIVIARRRAVEHTCMAQATCLPAKEPARSMFFSGCVAAN